MLRVFASMTHDIASMSFDFAPMSNDTGKKTDDFNIKSNIITLMSFDFNAMSHDIKLLSFDLKTISHDIPIEIPVLLLKQNDMNGMSTNQRNFLFYPKGIQRVFAKEYKELKSLNARFVPFASASRTLR